MSKSTDSITYHYVIEDAPHGFHFLALTRHHVGTAYPRNGNVGNPTEYFTWSVVADGEAVGGRYERRSDAYERGRAKALGIQYVNDERRKRYVNVRSFRAVEREMKQNYVSRTVHPDSRVSP